MLKFLKEYWFAAIITSICLFFMSVAIIVAVSPRQDNLDRGFIPCTKNMVERMRSCENMNILCISKLIVRNGWCDVTVIFKGIGDWLDGKQPRPWSNYLFEPETGTPNEEDVAEQLSEYYEQNPDIKAQMEELHRHREELERQLRQPTVADAPENEKNRHKI